MELLDRMLRDYDEDRREGKTMRSLHEALRTHTNDDRDAFDRLGDKISALRADVARQEGRTDAGNTGNWRIPPPVTVNVERDRHSHRPSIAALPSWMQKVLLDPKVVAAVLAALAVASHFVRSCIPGAH
jgi:hypothetical protein